MKSGLYRQAAGGLFAAAALLGAGSSALAAPIPINNFTVAGVTGNGSYDPTTGAISLALSNGQTVTGNINSTTGVFTLTSSNGCTVSGNTNSPGVSTLSPAGCAFGGTSGGSTGGTTSTSVTGTVRGTLPFFYIATTQSYFEVSQLGHTAQQATQVSIDAIQSVTTGIRDSIMRNRPRGGPNSFAWDPYADNDNKNDPFAKFAAYGDSVPGALGYAKSPIYTKAAPVALPSGVQFAIWGQGFADQEKRAETFLGADVGRTTTTYGGLAGFDAAFSNWLGFGGTYVIGALGGYTESHVRNNDGSTSRVSGPGVGLYSVWAKGGWSIDTVSKADFFNIDRWQTGIPVLTLGMTNYTSAGNINYRFDMPNNWWIEPTAGVSYTANRWDTPSKILGMLDGETFRVQAGSRFGTSTVWGRTTVEGSVTGLAYSDVVINGNTLAVAAGALLPTPPNDQGKVFGQGIGKLNFIWSPQISSYVEGEVRGRDGVIGYAGRVGARYSFQ